MTENYDLCTEMLRSIWDNDNENPEGNISVEIAERLTENEKGIYLRVAKQGSKMDEIFFYNREQLETLTKALIRYLDSTGSITKLLK